MRRFAAMTIITTMLWAGAAYAQPGGGRMGGGFGPGPGMMLPMLLHNLGLTDAQHQQVRTILNAHRAKFEAFFLQLRDAQQAIDAKLLSAAPVQLADVMPQMQQVTDLRKQVMQEGVAVALEVRGVLTPEQLARAGDLHTQVAALRAQMRKLIGEPPMGPPGDD